MGREAIPLQEPLWDYNSPEGEACRDRMVHYLLAGMNSTAQEAINYNKLREITQKSDKNPSEFLKCLKETLGAFTKVNPASALGSSLLAMHFITQSAPDIRHKLKKAEDGPQTPLGDLVDMAIKVFHAREDESERRSAAQMAEQTHAITAALWPARGDCWGVPED